MGFQEQEQDKRRVLEVLVAGGSCSYAFMSGNTYLFDEKGERIKGGIDISTFLDLKSEGLIEMTGKMKRGNFAVRIEASSYGITDQGREYLGREAQS